MAVLGAMMLLWLLSLALRDSSIADVAWGPLFVLVAVVGLVEGGGWLPRKLFMAAMISVWALRLALHIGVRNRGGGEDPRYAEWRREHGGAWPLRSLIQVFLLQGAILLVVASPVHWVMAMPGAAGWTRWDLAGLVVWAAGLTLEIVADRQLRRFKEAGARRGAFLDEGLWRYSRHPNYFGEAVLWWGLALPALALPLGWISLVGPLLITLLLRFVSGVPMTEERMRGRPGWAEYAGRTNAFIPGPKR